MEFLAKTYGPGVHHISGNTPKFDVNNNLQQLKKRSDFDNNSTLRMNTNPYSEDTLENSNGGWTFRSVKAN